jgi:RNA polymerase sigma-70 factor (ECF subfamily)
MAKVEAVPSISDVVSSSERSGEYVAATVGHLRAQLYSRALFLTQQRDAADDLVQEVCERALRAGERFQVGTNLTAWLNRIMRNLFVDEYREQRKFVRDFDWERSELAAPPDEREDTLYDRFSHDDLIEGLEALRPRDRQILELALLEHRSYKQLAAQFGVCPQTVGTRIHRAKKHLKAHLLGHGASRGKRTPRQVARQAELDFD